MKKIVFIHPQGNNWTPGLVDVTRLANVMPPHGLITLSSWLSKHGFENDIVDCYAHPMVIEELIARILELKADAVGISTTTSSFPSGYRTAEALKAAKPGLPVILGGVHPTSIWNRILTNYPAVDMIVVGEGEPTLQDLAQNDYIPSESIRGLAFRDTSGEVRYGGPRELMQDLDQLPFPAYDKLQGFPMDYPLPIFNYPRGPATSFISSRGCPYACSYCDRSVFRSTFRYHSAAYVVEQLQWLKNTYGIRHVNIYDDNFLLLRERVQEFCELKLKSGLKTTFNCCGRVDRLDPELLRLMKQAGCWQIAIGVESGDEELMSAHRMNNNLETTRQVVRWINEAGIRVKGLFMIGIPGETERTIRSTISFAIENGFTEANLTKFTPFPGAPVYSTIQEFGEFTEDWERMNCNNFVFIPKGFTQDQLESWYSSFYRSFYSRPAMLIYYLSMVWKSPESWRRFLRNLPAFLSVKHSMDQAEKKVSLHSEE